MKQRDNEKMRQLYDQWQSSGLSMKAFSQQNNIRSTTFYYWVKKFKNEDLSITETIGEQRFSQIPVPGSVSSVDQKALTVIHFPSGIRLELFFPVEATFLKSIIH